MTCSSCGSENFVAIQNENYCLKCGRLLSGRGADIALPIKPAIDAVVPAAGPVVQHKAVVTEPVKAVFTEQVESPSKGSSVRPETTKDQPVNPPLSIWDEIKSAVSTSKIGKYYYYGLSGGLLISLVLFYFYLADTAAAGSQAKALLTLLAILITLPAYGFKVYGSNAILFGAAKDADHRRAEKDTWYMAAFNSFWPAVGLELAVLCLVGVLATALAFLLGLVSEFAPDVVYVISRVLCVAVVAVAALLASVVVAFGRYLVVVAGVGVHRSIRVGLKIAIYRLKESLLAGLCALAVNAAAVSMILLVDILTSPGSKLVGFGLILVSVLVITSWLIVFNQIFWLRIFRLVLPYSHKELLSGRQPRPVKPAAAYSLAAAIIAIGVFATYASIDTGSIAEIYLRLGTLLSD